MGTQSQMQSDTWTRSELRAAIFCASQLRTMREVTTQELRLPLPKKMIHLAHIPIHAVQKAPRGFGQRFLSDPSSDSSMRSNKIS